jgi:serine protease
MTAHHRSRMCGRAWIALGILVATIAIARPASAAAEPTRVTEPLTVAVDRTVRPRAESLAAGTGRDGAVPVAALADTFGNQGEFIADELIVASADRDALDRILERWHGTVLKTVEPGRAEIHAAPRHLVRIDTDTVATDTLVRDLGHLEPDVRGAQRVSTDQGLALLAAAARAGVEGLDVDLNWLGEEHTIRTRTTTEVAGAPNPFTQPDLCEIGKAGATVSTCLQSISVGEAWSLLARSGRLPVAAPLRMAIIDGGFPAGGDPDWPPIIAQTTSGPNPLLCSGGLSCPFHGHNVTSTAMDLVDNNLGYAGIAGLVASPIQLPAGIAVMPDVFTVTSSLNIAVATGARVVNMSFGGMVPAAGAAFAGGFDLFVQSVRAKGIVLFASAGNAGQDVDVVHCAIFCWEAEYAWPCETTGVLCIGGLDFNSRADFPLSNFGRGGLDPGNSVDVWAPFFVRVGLDPSDPGFPNGTKLFTGTSAASPFAAGVAALIWAGSPSLTAAQVEGVLLGTASLSSVTSSRSKPSGELMVDAEAGVLGALGGNAPPEISIVKPASGSVFPRGLVHVEANATDDGGTPTVVWFVDGKAVDTGMTANLWLFDRSFGSHKITAVAQDGTFSTPDADGGIKVQLTNQAPTVSIVGPTSGQNFSPISSPTKPSLICLEGKSSDANFANGSLPESNVAWEIDGTFVASGHRATIDAPSLGVGTHTIRFAGTDDGGLVAAATVTVTVGFGPPVVGGPGGGLVVVGC